MIFVTVGTHEQPFNRLIEYIDHLKEDEKVADEIILQTGYCTYEPKYCKWDKFISYTQMERNIADARIVITHGGPASFIMPLQIGKIPIVVPRQLEFGEHVNNHQVEFTKKVTERMGTIISVFDIQKLNETIQDYDTIVAGMNKILNSNNENFCINFNKIVYDVMNL